MTKAWLLLLSLAVLPLAAKPPADGTWELAFQDDFDGTRLDPEVWQSQAGPSGHILSSRWPENVEVKDGLLRLLTKQEERAGQQWTSGNVWTKPQFGPGYYEARYRYGAAAGLNNAFWLWKVVPWKTGGLTEIDINEGHYPNEINTNIHYHRDHRGAHHFGNAKAFTYDGLDLAKEFHTYGLQWTPSELIFYFDDQPIRTLPHNIFVGEGMQVMFSSAVAKFAGAVTDALDGTAMEVDWVKVYRRNEPWPTRPASAPLKFPAAIRWHESAGLDTCADGELPASWHRLRGTESGAASLQNVPVLRWTTVGGKADTLETVQPASEAIGNRGLALVGNDLVYAPLPEPVNGPVLLTFDLMLSSPWTTFTLATAGPGYDPERVRQSASEWAWTERVGLYLTVVGGGYLRCYADNAWHELGLVDPGVWLNVQLRLDPADGTFELAATGMPPARGRFRNPVDGLAGLVFHNRPQEDEPAPAYFANLRVGELPAAP